MMADDRVGLKHHCISFAVIHWKSNRCAGVIVFQMTSAERRCFIRVRCEAPDGEPSTKTLQKALQSWCNTQSPPLTLENPLSLADGSTEFDIHPAPDVKLLQGLNGQTLKAKRGKPVRITWISSYLHALPPARRAPLEEPAQAPEESMQPADPSHVDRPEPPAESAACLLSVSHFWYLSHVYKDEIHQILEANGVDMEPEVKVAFKLRREDGSEARALEEFTRLTRKTLSGSDTAAFPLKQLDAQRVVDSLDLVKARDDKLLLVLSSQEVTVHGPSQRCDAVRRSLAAPRGSTRDLCQGAAQPPSLRSADLVLNIRDHLREGGLSVEKRDWEQLQSSASLRDIAAKFGVRLEGRDSHGGQFTSVRAVYRGAGGNASMESHATRALLRCYQRFAASRRREEARSLGPAESRGAPPGGAASNGQGGPSSEGEAALGGAGGEGASGRDGEDEKCPICFDPPTDAVRLQCEHQFCRDCLRRSVRSQGKICPVCRDVFGALQGDQPPGTMRHARRPAPLPGFDGCGTIVIDYCIPSGIQTEEHPKPGRLFSGASRTAYLPDNEEGNEVLRLLTKAFEQKLIFTVGRSRTTGKDDQVTWNDIHHKTFQQGGPQNFGYPDPKYLARVKDELKSKGIV